MAFKNPETKKYEAHYFVKKTGQLLVGEGETKEEAIKDLKKKKNAYFANPLLETMTEIRSPGYRYFQDQNGNIQSERSDTWKTKTKARPELIETINKKK